MPTKSRYLACISQPVQDCAAHYGQGDDCYRERQLLVVASRPHLPGRPATDALRPEQGLRAMEVLRYCYLGSTKLYGMIGVAGTCA